MKVEFEKRIEKGTSFIEVNTILYAVFNCGFKDVQEVANALNNIPRFSTLIFGCGSNHMWVKELKLVPQKWWDFSMGKKVALEQRLMIIYNK